MAGTWRLQIVRIHTEGGGAERFGVKQKGGGGRGRRNTAFRLDGGGDCDRYCEYSVSTGCCGKEEGLVAPRSCAPNIERRAGRRGVMWYWGESRVPEGVGHCGVVFVGVYCCPGFTVRCQWVKKS